MAQDISTNPAALRNIASGVITYAKCQEDTIQDYLRKMEAQQQFVSTARFVENLNWIVGMKKMLEDKRRETEEFAAWLNEKARVLEEEAAKRG